MHSIICVVVVERVAGLNWNDADVRNDILILPYVFRLLVVDCPPTSKPHSTYTYDWRVHDAIRYRYRQTNACVSVVLCIVRAHDVRDYARCRTSSHPYPLPRSPSRSLSECCAHVSNRDIRSQVCESSLLHISRHYQLHTRAPVCREQSIRSLLLLLLTNTDIMYIEYSIRRRWARIKSKSRSGWTRAVRSAVERLRMRDESVNKSV